MCGRVVCMVGSKGDVHGRGHAWQGACMAGREVYMAGETATAADSMHPTGMHSCFNVAKTLLNNDKSRNSEFSSSML